MSTAEHPDALARRLERLAAALPEGPVEAVPQAESVVELVEGLRAELAGVRQDLAAQSAAHAAAQRELRRDLDELGAGMVSATSALVAELRARSAREADHLRTSLEAVRAGADTRAEELAGTLARGLLDIAEEVDVAVTATRDAAQRVTLLAELTQAQRVSAERLLHEVHVDVVDAVRDLREELLARTSTLLGELGSRLDGVEVRLAGVDGTVAGGTVAAERVAAGLDALTATAERLDAAVSGFRAEWPTRTYEVVRGARAVAEGVVLDVRAEVGARLDDVRATLERVVATVDPARADRDAAGKPEAAPAAAERVLARPPVARQSQGGAGGSAVVPGPGRAVPPPARSGSRTVAAPGRGRLSAMPEAPRVDVALDAAASRDDDRD